MKRFLSRRFTIEQPGHKSHRRRGRLRSKGDGNKDSSVKTRVDLCSSAVRSLVLAPQRKRPGSFLSQAFIDAATSYFPTHFRVRTLAISTQLSALRGKELAA